MPAVRLRRVAEKEGREQRGERDAEGPRHHLRRQRDAVGHAGVLIRNVGVDQRVHARELQRRKKSLHETERQDEPEWRAGADEGKHQQRQAEAHGVGDENLPVTEAFEQRRAQHLHRDGGDRLRHREQAGLPRGETHADLIEQGQQERHAAHAEPRDDAAEHSDVEGARAEKFQPDDGLLRAAFVPRVGEQQRGDDAHQGENRAQRQTVFAENFKEVGQHSDGAAEEEKSAQVERRHLGGLVVGHVALD